MTLLRHHIQVLSVVGLVVAQLLLFTGCDTGSRGISGPPEPPAPPFEVTGITPEEGGAGLLMTISGFGFNPDPGLNRVTFNQVGGAAEIPGQIIDVIVSGFDSHGRTITDLIVIVPTAVRTSGVVLESYYVDPDGIDPPTWVSGSRNFTGDPVIVSVVYGNQNNGFGTVDLTEAVQGNVDLILIGYNLFNAIGAMLIDEQGNDLAPMATIAPGAGGFPIPPGMSAATVTIPSGTDIFFTCVESAFLRVQLLTAGAGANPLTSNEVIAKFRKVAPGFAEPLHGSVTSLLVPAGVRSGLVEVHFNVHSEDEYSTRFDVTPQYLDAAGTWLDCTVVGYETTDFRVLSGTSDEPSLYPALPAVGHSQKFTWDTITDLPDFEGTTRLRILLEQVGNELLCDQLQEGEMQSGAIAICNIGVSPTSEGAGSVDENFASTFRLNPIATDVGVWIDAAGEIIGVADTETDAFGAGDKYVTLTSDGPGLPWLYTFDTDNGVILVDDPNGTQPTPLTSVENPGSNIGEFHIGGLIIDAVSEIRVVGSNPLIIRASGVNVPGGDPTIAIQGEINVSGQAGESVVTNDVPGMGGVGVAGGFDGGMGSVVIAGAAGTIQDVFHGTSGEGPGAGTSGQSTSWLNISPASARGGPGGGGGHGEAGGDGVNTASGNNIVIAPSGLGGSAHGDTRLMNPIGGSGGGGGGSAALFNNPNSQSRSGGGGGAGGGVVEMFVNGDVVVSGSIISDGGAGGAGFLENQPRGAPGGGGAGGSIAIRASDAVTVTSTGLLRARGGAGGGSGVSIGGRGGDGRIHLESNGLFDFAGFNDVSGLEPGLSDAAVDAGMPILGIEVGAGGDGALNLGSESAGTIWVVNTGVTPLDHAQVYDETGMLQLTAGQPGGIFEVTSLTIPEGVTLRAFGANPLVIRVSGSATVDGTIDVSGGPGGLVDTSDPNNPIAGMGGLGGPGGGGGGRGGWTDGTTGENPEDGHLPPGLSSDLIEQTPYSSGNPTDLPVQTNLAVAAAAGTNSAAGSLSLLPSSAGGGGYAVAGEDASLASGSLPPGTGGSAYLSNDFVHPAELTPEHVGGGGGGGGGGSNLMDIGVPHSPGSGGGGGGGFLQLSVGGIFTLSSTAALLAEGGDAFVGPQFGANGGAGAGGAIRIQGLSVLQIDGARISVAGGTADRPIDEHPDVLQVANATYAPNIDDLGGNGATGRIQIESPAGVNTDPAPPCGGVAMDGICPRPSIGGFILAEAAAVSVAETLPYQVRVDGGAFPGLPIFEPTIRQQPGFSAEAKPTVLTFISGAPESLEQPGSPGEFSAWTDDPTLLRDAHYIRMRHILIGRVEPAGGVIQPTLEAAGVDFKY